MKFSEYQCLMWTNLLFDFHDQYLLGILAMSWLRIFYKLFCEIVSFNFGLPSCEYEYTVIKASELESVLNVFRITSGTNCSRKLHVRRGRHLRSGAYGTWTQKRIRLINLPSWINFVER